MRISRSAEYPRKRPRSTFERSGCPIPIRLAASVCVSWRSLIRRCSCTTICDFNCRSSASGSPRSAKMLPLPTSTFMRRFLVMISALSLRKACSGQRLAAHVGRALDLDQHADPLVGAVVLLLALGEALEDRLAHGAGLIELSGAVEAQEAGVEHAVALRLEVGIHDGDAAVVAEILQCLALGALPIGEVLVVVDQHRALGGDVRAVRPLRCQQARRAVGPGVVDEVLDLLADRHGAPL